MRYVLSLLRLLDSGEGGKLVVAKGRHDLKVPASPPFQTLSVPLQLPPEVLKMQASSKRITFAVHKSYNS